MNRLAVGGPVGPNTGSQFMSLARTVADVIDQHVVLELDPSTASASTSISQAPNAHAGVLLSAPVSGQGAVSSHKMRTIPQPFLRTIEQYADRHGVPILRFEKGQRKEDLAADYLKRSDGSEGLLLIGKAQEKVRTFRTAGRRNERGETYPWIVETTTLANQYYFCGVDDDFGPFFLKYSSYFPYGAKLCFNGHEFLKRQLAKEGIGFEELANGILSCDNPARL